MDALKMLEIGICGYHRDGDNVINCVIDLLSKTCDEETDDEKIRNAIKKWTINQDRWWTHLDNTNGTSTIEVFKMVVACLKTHADQANETIQKRLRRCRRSLLAL